MEKYHIEGGVPLRGEVDISGAKNAALPILAASVMTKGENCFTCCPEISDVDSMVRILEALGCSIRRDGETMAVDATGLSDWRIPDHLMKEMRSSVFLAGSLLARCGEAVISNPGGCNIGKRPIDIHIKGLKALGAVVERHTDSIVLKADKLKGTHIRLDYPSVGATENLLLAATAAQGTTIIENSAREPEITDLQEYINRCGGRVFGAGTGRIVIEGGMKLAGSDHRIIGDRIEAGSYLLMAMGTGGEVFLRGIKAEPIGSLIEVLESGGYSIKEDEGGVWARSKGHGLVSCRVTTKPYPGFPTDLHPQLAAFLTANGKSSSIEETIFENRFNYAKQLVKMGADIEILEKKVIIGSNKILYGEKITAEDLRGGAALIIAGLMATGDTIVQNTRYIKRGYSRLSEKIGLLGGKIREYE
ncbi:MAG: UDP-N-acetylglucosamine 1-carboxyvinyltransferase [Bacillota bacterium]|nr:UDP-N-acetylglucosamine 1-carboxyvinyltransferase [Bacillota bacterium]